MRYFGGKARVGRRIARFLESIRDGRSTWEPFCGACGVTTHLSGEVYASDLCLPLISMWQDLQRGWVPPSIVTEQDYAHLRDRGPSGMQAFVGFGCSFGGKWFGGYARGKQHPDRAITARNYASNARTSVLKQSAAMGDVLFYSADFMSSDAPTPQCMIYCDPPFAGTTGFPGLPKFDAQRFWDRCDYLVSLGHAVVVSEYTAPAHWHRVLEVRRKKSKRLGHGAPVSLVYSGDIAVGRHEGEVVDVESLWISDRQKGLGGG